MSGDIVAFVRARLDECERLARAANVKQDDPQWRVSPDSGTTVEAKCTVRSVRDSRPIARVEQLDGDDGEPAAILDARAAAEHIAAHDPASVLRQVQVLRAVVDFCDRHMDGVTVEDYLGAVLELVAAMWSDHSDYDPSWGQL